MFWQVLYNRSLQHYETDAPIITVLGFDSNSVYQKFIVYILNHENAVRDVDLSSFNIILFYINNTINPQISPLPLISRPPPFSGKKVSKPPISIKPPPLPSPIYSSLINDRLYQSTTMVYLPTGRSDFILILSCAHDLKLLVFELFHFFGSLVLYMENSDTIVVFKLNKPPSQISPPSLLSPPSNGLEINKPPGGF